MSERAHILVVEDESATRQLVARYFETEGYKVTEAHDGQNVIPTVMRENIDIVLLDIRLPESDGLELTRQLRAVSDVGIILVTAKTDEIDRIVGLELGADDYVTKPFNSRELFARTKNLIKRVRRGRQATLTATPQVYQFENWKLDAAQHRLLRPDGARVRLTEGEYQLLAKLVNSAQRIVSRELLLESINHKSRDATDRTVDVMIGKLRRKLDDDPANPVFIKTIRAVGYMFTADVSLSSV